MTLNISGKWWVFKEALLHSFVRGHRKYPNPIYVHVFNSLLYLWLRASTFVVAGTTGVCAILVGTSCNLVLPKLERISVWGDRNYIPVICNIDDHSSIHVSASKQDLWYVLQHFVDECGQIPLVYIPILIYCQVLWVVTKRITLQVHLVEVRLLHIDIGHTLCDRVRSWTIREIFREDLPLLRIERRQVKWLGHLTKMLLVCFC